MNGRPHKECGKIVTVHPVDHLAEATSCFEYQQRQASFSRFRSDVFWFSRKMRCFFCANRTLGVVTSIATAWVILAWSGGPVAPWSGGPLIRNAGAPHGLIVAARS